MSHVTITRVFEIDYGHRLLKHPGKCVNYHGHRGRFERQAGGWRALQDAADHCHIGGRAVAGVRIAASGTADRISR